MKVTLITENFIQTKGGAEQSTLELARRLSHAGLDITLVAGTVQYDRPEELPFTIQALPVTGASRLGRWRNFQKAAAEHRKKNDYDIVHSLVPLSGADIYQPRGGSIRYSARRHARSYDSFFSVKFKLATLGFNRARQARAAAEKKLCAATDGPVIAALSQYVARQFKEEYHLPDHRIRVIPNGIDMDRCNTEEARATGRKLRKQFDKNGDLALFLFVAQNPRLKGLRPLIYAAQRARERRRRQRDFRILLVAGWKYASYWRLARQLDLNQHLIFMGATRYLMPLLHLCDGVVLPTYNDACSRIILEALAAGKPGITTGTNGAAEFLGEGKYGCVINDSNDIDSLAGALLRLCDREQQQQLCDAIRDDRVAEQVSVGRHVQQLVELYQEILANK